MLRFSHRLRRIADRVAARRMCVFDFDDTLVSSSSSVTVEHGNGEMTVLDSASFAYYKPEGGDKIDFSDFNHVTRPRVIKKGMDAIRKASEEKGTRVVILTARPKGSASAVKKFMDHLGMKDVEVAALQSSDPMDKARWIEREAGDAEEVEFTDDSSRNVAAVETLKGKIKGKVSTVNPAHPKEEDYKDKGVDDVFKSDVPVPAEMKVKGPPGTSSWWKDQSPEFQGQYCKDHPGSKYCGA